MKLIRLLLLCLVPLSFVACTNTREELEIKGDGSGTLAIKTDVSKMLALLKQFSGDNAELEKNGMDKAFDTVMLMKDYIDTVKDLPADQKALLRNGKAHVIMNMKEGIGKFDLNFPYGSSDKLPLLYSSLSSSSQGLKNAFNGIGKNLPNSGQGDDKGMPMISSVFNIVAKDGLYSRKVNKEKYDAFAQAMNLEQLKQMGSMFGEMDYTLQVKTPRPVKRVSNSNAVLSDNKKTVTLKTDLMEVFQHPELLSVDIEY